MPTAQNNLVLPPLGDYNRAWWLSVLLAQMQQPDAYAQVNGHVRSRFPNVSTLLVIGGTSTPLPYMYVDTPQFSLIGMLGIQNISDASAIINGYTGPRTLLLGAATNAWLQ